MSDEITAPLGVTLRTPGYEALAEEAVRRFKKASGCNTVLIIDAPGGAGWEAKLSLPELCPARPIVFFDADWWALRAFDVRDVMVVGSGIAGVHEPTVFDPEAHAAKDCETLVMSPMAVINTGFFACDLSDRITQRMFREAREMLSRRDEMVTVRPIADPTDQVWLNYARQTGGVLLRLLPLRYNFFLPAAQWGCVPSIPRGIIGLHAAGYPLENKQHTLETQAAVFGGAWRPTTIACQEARHAAIFDGL